MRFCIGVSLLVIFCQSARDGNGQSSFAAPDQKNTSVDTIVHILLGFTLFLAHICVGFFVQLIVFCCRIEPVGLLD